MNTIMMLKWTIVGNVWNKTTLFSTMTAMPFLLGGMLLGDWLHHKFNEYLNDQELKTAMECRAKIVARKIDIEEAFQHNSRLLAKIKTQFSMIESSSYTLKIRIAPEAALPGRWLVTSLRIDSAFGEEQMRFYQWLWY